MSGNSETHEAGWSIGKNRDSKNRVLVNTRYRLDSVSSQVRRNEPIFLCSDMGTRRRSYCNLGKRARSMAIWSNVYLTRPAVPRIDTQKAEGKAHDWASA